MVARGRVRTVELVGRRVVLIDQTRLPSELRLVECKSAEEVARAIERMQIRGAPVLAIAAAMGLALTALRSRAKERDRLLRELESTAKRMRRTRPTGFNLFVGIDRVLNAARSGETVEEVRDAVVKEAKRIAEEDLDTNRRIGEHGAKLLKDGDVVLTHCNAGALATFDYGTALGVVRTAWSQGKHVDVIVTETRPLLQGARLTAWELKRDGIPVTVITDGMVGAVFSMGKVDAVLVGADRIAVNGDVANKIGTYQIAVLAKEHRVPFYVVAPSSTIDPNARSGEDIHIEQRDVREVIFFGKTRVVPKGVKVLNPAFDITPARLVTAFVTELGIVKPQEVSSLIRRLRPA